MGAMFGGGGRNERDRGNVFADLALMILAPIRRRPYSTRYFKVAGIYGR